MRSTELKVNKNHKRAVRKEEWNRKDICNPRVSPFLRAGFMFVPNLLSLLCRLRESEDIIISVT